MDCSAEEILEELHCPDRDKYVKEALMELTSLPEEEWPNYIEDCEDRFVIGTLIDYIPESVKKDSMVKEFLWRRGY